MNHLWKKKLPLLIPFGILIMGFFTFAACPPEGINGRYCNPLGTTSDIIALIKKILETLLAITIPLAVLAIILSGLYYIINSVSGNSSKTSQAKGTLKNILIGSILVVGANALALAIINFLKGPI